jgi:site-specific DNA-methyltransferase (adenine-specific)
VQTNALYFGDNLKVLSERLPDGTYRFPSESVDLVYLDPPFNSNRDYNLIFKEQSGEAAEALIRAFTDTWGWDRETRETFEDLTSVGVNEGRIPDNVGRLIDSLVRGIGRNDMTAYLVMMTPRLLQMHRVLKSTGLLWLHCDPTANGYLRVLLDAIFDPRNFRNEVVWQRTPSKSLQTRRLPTNHDVLLVYGKSSEAGWNQDSLFSAHDPAYIASKYPYADAETGRRYGLWDLTNPNKDRPNLTYEFMGITKVWRWTKERMQKAYDEGLVVQPRPGAVPRFKRYLDEQRGVALGDVWTDIDPINSQARERLGYPTQKPLALLERIIQASTEPGEVVLDPFCGCGTALIASEKLKRKWVGVDITHLSIAVMRARLMDSFGLASVPVYGVPADVESARLLAQESKDGRYEFQWWALGLVDAKPLGADRKKGADKGIDGVLTFSERDSIQRILVSVKSGKPGVQHVKELIATLGDQGGAIGVLIELDPPTEEMRKLSVNAGQYESELWGGSYERVQIVTVAELLAGKRPDVPKFLAAYQKAAKIAAAAGEQQELWESDLG